MIPKIDSIWCNEGGKQLRVTLLVNGDIKIETIDVTRGWPGDVVDCVTIAKFRLHRIRLLIDESISPIGG